MKFENQRYHACFVNLDIATNINIFLYKLFDQRDTVLFTIFLTPHIDSNILQNIFYSEIKRGFIKHVRSTLFLDDFIWKNQELLNRMQSQGLKSHTIKRTLRKII